MVLPAMTTPRLSTEGGASGVGEAAKEPTMPESLQSESHAYSPSTEFPRISSPDWKIIAGPHSLHSVERAECTC